MKKLGRVLVHRLVNVTGGLWDVLAGWEVEADFLVDPKRWFYIAQCLNVTCYSYETEGAGILFLLSAILESLWCLLCL